MERLSYKICKTDDVITKLAKQAAIICECAIHNPLHVYFEDGNFHREWTPDFEFKCNEKYRCKNGDYLYLYIKDFLKNMESLNKDDKLSVYRLFKKKWKYLANKWDKDIGKYSKVNKTKSCIYRKYLGEDGHIYIETNIGVKILVF